MAVLALERLVDVQERLHGVLARRHIVQAGASIAHQKPSATNGATFVASAPEACIHAREPGLVRR